MDRHLRHIARATHTPAADMTIALDAGGVQTGAATTAIRKRVHARGGQCTWAAARERLDAADRSIVRYLRERKIGDLRRVTAKTLGRGSVAERTRYQIERLFVTPLSQYGGRYSGETSCTVTPVGPTGRISAESVTQEGERYTQSSRWHKTDATHHYRLSLTRLIRARRLGIPPRIDGHIVVAAVRVRPQVYHVTLIQRVGKQVVCRKMHASDQGGGMWHLANTERGAVTALHRSREDQSARIDGRVTGQLCREWGWCRDGIRSWCAHHRITRDITGRLRRGVKSGALERLIERHGGPRDVYERRLVGG
jgi:hypothetical protein